MNFTLIEKYRDLLRSDEYAKLFRFDMDTWSDDTDDEVCGTVGCIAGTIVNVELLPFGAKKVHQQGLTAVTARGILGLDQRTADHLFIPSSWVLYLSPHIEGPEWLKAAGQAPGTFDNLSSNLRPSLNTVAEMKAWAESFFWPKLQTTYDGNGDLGSYRSIDRFGAANVLDGLLNHPGYVDWREAFEPA